jgi:hypothetical protein
MGCGGCVRCGTVANNNPRVYPRGTPRGYTAGYGAGGWGEGVVRACVYAKVCISTESRAPPPSAQQSGPDIRAPNSDPKIVAATSGLVGWRGDGVRLSVHSSLL